VNRFPVQLLEASLNLLLFAFLVILLKKGVMKGNLMWIYGSIYPVIRFFDEFLRGDAIRGFVFGLSTSQWISIFVFVLSVTMIIIRVCKKPAPAMPVPTQEESIQATDESIQATDVPSSHLPETAPATDISFNKTDTI
jgi:prolipoprotein diacylglyceryltransferase